MVHILIISKFVDFPVLSCVYICFICVVFNAMTSKPSSSEDAQSAIEQLQSVLEQNYLRAEKIMALRNPNNELLKEILTEINHDYDALIGAMASANLGSEAIVAVTQNQNEFESRKDEWFTKVKESSSASVSTMPHLLYEPHRSPSHVSSTSYSRHSLKSSRSSSSRHSRKHLEAKARLKMAQLESNHLEERVREEEQRLRLEAEEREQRLRLEAEEREQRLRLEAEEREKRLNLETETKQKHFQLKRMIEKGEASRKIALAEVEYQVYCEHDSIYKLSCDDVTAATSIANSDDTISTVVADPSKQIEALSSQVSVAGSLPAQSSLNIGLAQGSLPAQSSLITGPAQGSLPVRSSLVADSAQGSLPSKPFLNSGPAQGSLTVRPSLVADSAQGSLPVRSSLVADSAQGSLPSKPFLNSGPAQGSLTVRPSLVADSAQGFLPVRSSLVADSAQGSLPFKSSLNSGPAQGSLLAQPSLTADPVQSSQHAPATFSSVYGHPPVRPYNTFVDKAYSSIQPQPFAPSSQVHDAQPVGVPAAQLDSSHPSRVVTSSTPPSVSCANNNLMNSNNLLLPVHLPGLYTPSAANYDSLFLPRPEFTKFSGDPLEFKTFMSNFETHVEPRVRDEKALFCLLLQHCTGEVKNRIEYLSTSETQPYTLAKQRLTKDYGSPWVIADVCEQQLKKFPSIKSGDGRQMRRFAELLEKTNVVVKDIRQYTSLDTLDTLSELLGKLPYDLKGRWVKKSVQVETSVGHLANFSHFVDFIRNESEEVNSLFGLRSLHPKTSPSKPKVKTSSFGVVTSKSTSIKSSESKSSAQPGSCYFCKDTSHMLWDCKKFREKTVQDRICFVKELKLCHKCLSARHRTPECKKNNTCSSSGCKGLYHHTLLHRPDKESKGKPKSRDISTSTTDVAAAAPVTCGFTKQDSSSHSCDPSVYLCIVPVKVAYGDKVVSTYAFLDQGSTHSFCGKSLVQELGITGLRENLHLKTITGTTDNYESMSCDLVVSDLGNEISFRLPNVHSVDDIPVKPNDISVDAKVRNLPHLQDVKLKSLPHASVNLLIGADAPELFCIYSARKGPRGTPCAIETPLGWSLLGPSLSPSQETNCTVNFIDYKPNRDATQLVEKMWENEFDPGTSIFESSSKEDRIAYTVMRSSICETHGHYQLPLLWKEGYIDQLPDNLFLAQRRLISLKKRLVKDEKLRIKYTEVMDSYLSKGYARKVPQSILANAGGPVWYLPHHPVTNVHKPDKVRIVFDCAAKYNGLSLNDALMKGPHLMNNLTGVLTRFREKEIALVADVEAMFHQVRVDPMHTNALRFLWWENGNVNQEPIICQMLVHLFGATSSPSCANFSLRQTALEFGHHYDPVISSIVNNNFYVDDCLVSLSSVQEASYVYHNLTKLLERRGFHLTKWITNNEKVLSEIPESERSTKAQQYLLGNQTDDRILGIQWKVNEDQFTFDIKIPNKPFTRRGLLSTVASLFDPLGFVAPVLLEAKRLLQVLCKQNLGWDELIGDAEQKRWKDWLESLPALNNVKVPRCFKPADFGRVVTVQIHHFADASSYGYGACSYLRLVNEQGIICLSFLMGKSRLAAMKSVSIPRLELTAAVLAVRLDELTKGELDLSVPSFFWIDSTAVLYCIKNITKRFPVFVANRLATIETHTDVNQWHHVPSSLNPADAASRGLEADNSISKNWLQGPSFLLQPQSKWPSLEATMDEPPNELRPVKAQTVQTIIKTNRTEEAIDRLINHCSSFHKLKRLTAWFLRVMLFLQHCVMKKTFSMSKSLSVDELRNAEAVLIKHVQHQQFPDCFASKSNKLNLPRNLQKLQPIVVDGILRVGGRLKQAPFDIDVKHPIIIPQRSHLTELVIRQHHAEVGHSGSSHTWTSLRRKFWIIKGGAAVRKSIGNCYLCKKRNSNVGKQLMADIPSCRLQFDKPAFSSVGVDYFGPVMVKLLRNKLVKRYGCIFTCLTMRAVHIEIAHSLDTDSFINALRRFIARRGRPQNIFSDNGTNFVGAAKVLRESLRSLNENKIHQYCSQQDINWTFNPPTASHMGGAWERMIRSIRKILKGILGAQTLNDEGLLTFITEVESIINSRPLVPVSFSDTSQDPLTPNHLLLLRGNPNLPPGLFFKEDCYTRRRWAQIQFLANQFWKRWMDEFVPNLLHRQKWFEVKKNLQVNDVVLLVEDMTQRSKWVMGRVLETYPDKRGLVRTVLVKTQTNVVKRPIAKLCPVVTHAD